MLSESRDEIGKLLECSSVCSYHILYILRFYFSHPTSLIPLPPLPTLTQNGPVLPPGSSRTGNLPSKTNLDSNSSDLTLY